MHIIDDAEYIVPTAYRSPRSVHQYIIIISYANVHNTSLLLYLIMGVIILPRNTILYIIIQRRSTSRKDIEIYTDVTVVAHRSRAALGPATMYRHDRMSTYY